MKYVAMLRGINVSPTTRVAMPDLRAAFGKYTDVETILQSGNVVFSAPAFGPSALVALEDDIANKTGFEARVIVLPADDFRAVVAANPLTGDDPSRLVTTFLDGPPPARLTLPGDLGDEKIVVTDAAIYQWCPNGVSKSKLTPAWWKRLGPLATGRNQRTLEKIAALL